MDNNVSKILDVIEDYKQNMKDSDYKTVMDSLMKLNNKEKEESGTVRNFYQNTSVYVRELERQYEDTFDYTLGGRRVLTLGNRNIWDTNLYNVNPFNNVFKIVEDYQNYGAQTIHIQIEIGRYNIDQLCKELEEKLNITAIRNKYTVTKSEIEKKIMIEIDEDSKPVKILEAENTLNHLIGFRPYQTIEIPGIAVLSQYTYNMLSGPFFNPNI